jgi:hypothetical protein
MAQPRFPKNAAIFVTGPGALQGGTGASAADGINPRSVRIGGARRPRGGCSEGRSATRPRAAPAPAHPPRRRDHTASVTAIPKRASRNTPNKKILGLRHLVKPQTLMYELRRTTQLNLNSRLRPRFSRICCACSKFSRGERLKLQNRKFEIKRPASVAQRATA